MDVLLHVCLMFGKLPSNDNFWAELSNTKVSFMKNNISIFVGTCYACSNLVMKCTTKSFYTLNWQNSTTSLYELVACNYMNWQHATASLRRVCYLERKVGRDYCQK